MPIIRDSSKPQHNLTDFHYGSLPIEGLPDGPADSIAILLWDGTQWQFASVEGSAGVEVSYDATNNVLEIIRADLRTDVTMTADAYLVTNISGTFTADAQLV